MSRSKTLLLAAAAFASLSVGAGAAAVSTIIPDPVEAATAVSPAERNSRSDLSNGLNEENGGRGKD